MISLRNHLSTSLDAHSGYRFLDHAGDADTLAKINSKAWDFVILQDQSQAAAMKPEDVETNSLPHAITLTAAILANNPNTQIVYYVTWGREKGDPEKCADYAPYAKARQAGTDSYFIAIDSADAAGAIPYLTAGG